MEEKSKDTAQQIGFIAQQIEKVFPQLVKTDEKGFKSVAYLNIVPVLLEAIKEQQSEIEELKSARTELDQLKATVKKLQAMMNKNPQPKYKTVYAN